MSNKQNISKKGIFFVLLTALISGFAIFINKKFVSFTDPYIFTSFKNTFVGLFLLSLIISLNKVSKLKKLSIKNWLSLILIGLIGGGIPFLLYFKGLSLTTAMQASFIHKNLFLLVALLAPILLSEKVNKNFLIAGLFILIGNALLLTNAFPLSLSTGNLLVLAAVFFWAMENIISKKVLKSLDADLVSWGRMFFGSIFLIMFLGVTGRLGQISVLTSRQVLEILASSFILLSYVITWYRGLKLLPVTIATSILVLGSPVTAILTMLSGKALGLDQLIGIGFILISSFVIIEAASSEIKSSKAWVISKRS
ncbi:DMT family transporter [Patescibacteria group bacterium]